MLGRTLARMACVMLVATAAQTEDPLETVRRVSAEAETIPKQAEALALLAWPTEGETSPAVAAAARDRLSRFGHHALPALRASITRVPPRWTADVTATFIEARWSNPSGEPPDYLPGLVDALWYGSSEARRLAMLEVSRFGFEAAVSPIIDAVHADAALTGVAIFSLGRMGDVRARAFLNQQLLSGAARVRAPAALALAQLGRPGADALLAALRSTDPGVQRAAIEAVLPLMEPTDVTLLYEYVETHPTADPELLQRIRDRASELERTLEQQTDETAPAGA
jgi:hypothetical protein